MLDATVNTAHIIIMTEKVNSLPNRSVHSTGEEALNTAVANRIAMLRKQCGLTFDALALRSGVSKGTLVQIEQDRANPNISTLCRLAAALGVSVADLVAPTNEAHSFISVIAARAARKLWKSGKGSSAVLLAGTKGADMLEVWQWVLKAGDRYDAPRHGRGTRELIHVVDGNLLVEVDGQTSVVAAGATAIAQTDRPHAYINPGKSNVSFYMTVHEPVSAS
jgi:transcriptional regulator with XRE-family HTH domain